MTRRTVRHSLLSLACSGLLLAPLALRAQREPNEKAGPTLKQALDFLSQNTAHTATCKLGDRTLPENIEVGYEMRGTNDALITVTTATDSRDPETNVIRHGTITQTARLSDLSGSSFSDYDMGCEPPHMVQGLVRGHSKRVKVIIKPADGSGDITQYRSYVEFKAESEELQQRLDHALKRAIELAQPEPPAF